MADQLVQQNVSQTSIPDYARPYVEEMLGQARALTDLSQNPYMQYEGDRFAQFTPMQQQAFENASMMVPQSQIGDATALAGLAGLGALGTQYQSSAYNPLSFTQPGMSQAYMTPYMQDVVDVQQREARRQADISGQAQQAQAARAGAFGGARDIIQRSEANRALQTQLAGIQATGLQNAFQQAQQQFNAEQAQRQQAAQLGEQSRQFGAGLGLQGLQTALQGAGQLGQLGQQQFAQEMDINKLQQQYGTQQQQQMQNILGQQYQDFLNYQNYPYKQIGFMSDLLRGLPLTQTSTAMYGQAPSTTSQLVGLGTAALGASRLGLKKGGAVKAKKGGLSELAFMKITEGAA